MAPRKSTPAAEKKPPSRKPAAPKPAAAKRAAPRRLGVSLSKAAVVVLLGFAAGLVHAAKEPQIVETPDPADRSVDLEPVVAPKLSGVGLWAIARAVRTPILGSVVVGVLKNLNGVHRVPGSGAGTVKRPSTRMFFVLTLKRACS